MRASGRKDYLYTSPTGETFKSLKRAKIRQSELDFAQGDAVYANLPEGKLFGVIEKKTGSSYTAYFPALATSRKVHFNTLHKYE